MLVGMKKPTQKQLNFVHEYIKCGNAAEAYRIAYPTSKKWSNTNVATQADRLLKLPHIIPIVKELRKKAETDAVATRQECLAKITDIIRTSKNEKNVIAAVDRISKLHGWDAAQKIEHSGEVKEIVEIVRHDVKSTP